MIRRLLDRSTVDSVVLNPDQIVGDENDDDIEIYQSIVRESGTVFLYRVFLNTKTMPNMIVTLYKTTKVSKYYES